MKALVTLFIVLAATPVFPSGNQQKDKRDLVYEEALRNYKNQNYFTALDSVAKMYRFETPDQNTQNFLQKLVLKTGTHYFNTYSDLELRKINIPTTDLIMAKRNLYLDKFRYVHKRLKRVPVGNRLYPESLMVKASAYYFDEDYDKAVEYFNKCAAEANKRKNESENKIKIYFSVIEESCIIDVARLRFKQGEFEKAIRRYEDVPKTSIKWPYILLEKAWAYYYLGNYNRSLGLLITYNSPLLESYFMPEAEVLKALNYYQLCLYPDALSVVNRFYDIYKPKSAQLKKLIKSQNSELYFFDLMFKPISESEKEHNFLRNLITQVSKRVKYSLDLNSLYAVNSEIFQNHKDANIEKLLKTQKDLKEQINHY
ncbi:MAG: tetratricopeptide repeat protein, partial [Bacteriovoracaceae bacterium]